MIHDGKLNIAEDFPKSISDNMGNVLLFCICKGKEDQPYRQANGVCKFIKGDVLSVHEKKYTVDTLNVLDGDLDMRHFNERSDDNTVVMCFLVFYQYE